MKQNKSFIRIMKENGLTKRTLAGKLGLTEQSVYYWAIGRNKPSAMQLLALAKLFNMQVEDLYYMFKDHVDKKKQGDKKC